MSIEYELKDKTKSQLLDNYFNSIQGGKPNEFYKMAIVARCTTDIESSLKSLETSINKNANSSSNLSKKVFYLNIILTIATIFGVFIALFNLFYKCS